MQYRKTLLSAVVILILAVGIVAGLYFLTPSGKGTTSSTSTSASSSTNPIARFGQHALTIAVGSAPYGLAYDPLSGDTFVAVSGANRVVVVDNGSRVVGNITLGGAADFLAYDPSNSLLYAALIGSNSISIINTTLDAQVSSVPLSTGVGWLAYDPASGTVYSVNRETNVVSVVSGSTVVKNITLDGLPFASAYDPADGEMYVTNNAGAVFLINGTSNALVGSVQVGNASSSLLGIAYNPYDQSMFVTSYSDGEVYVVSGSQLAGSIGGFFSPTGIAFSPLGEMFVVNSGDDSVYASWDGQSYTVEVGAVPREVLFNSELGAIVVTNYGVSTLSVISA